jgi:hypothetical protein
LRLEMIRPIQVTTVVSSFMFSSRCVGVELFTSTNTQNPSGELPSGRFSTPSGYLRQRKLDKRESLYLFVFQNTLLFFDLLHHSPTLPTFACGPLTGAGRAVWTALGTSSL